MDQNELREEFKKLGERNGILPELVELITNHIFRGGDCQDLNWVWQGLQQMEIRPDLARRWFHCWRSYLNLPIPETLEKTVAVGS